MKCFKEGYEKIIDASTQEDLVGKIKCLICHRPDVDEEEIHDHFKFIKQKVIYIS